MSPPVSDDQRLLARARGGDMDAFAALCEPLRPELQLHCYRIVGSVHDGEDLVQETMLAAWRGLGGYEGRAALRTWLYRIATTRCLNALRDRGRRPRELGDGAQEPMPPDPTRLAEPLWLQPYPDALLGDLLDRAPEPAARYEARETIGLAFTIALQRLPPRQRAVLVLRDVLSFRASEVAEMLGVTEVAVNRTLQRARDAVSRSASPHDRDRAPAPDSPAERAIVRRFTDAFEAGDVPGLVALLRDDALLRMPPTPLEYEGPEAIGRFFSTVPAGGRLERFRLVATRANGQPAFGCYQRDEHAPIAHAYGLMVLTLGGDRVTAITGFPDTSVFASFGLPRTVRW